jgi:eukaryotic-like serine/threonine-protein kinase
VDDERSEAEYEDGVVVPGTSYRVVRLLGTGGMGQVYEVEHVELGRRYVLKTLLSTLAVREDLIARMRNEWRALGRLEHAAIVDVVHAGKTANAVPYYVMELLDGETLRERLVRTGRLPIPEAVRIARHVLFGLDAAHAIGIIHRDIKPANVFLTSDGGVKVLDFGIAKVRLEGAPKITAQGLAIGTPRYMSPEQAMGGKADARSDLYAVGLLLFEMITGDGPFDDSNDSAAHMLAHVNRPPPRISERATVPKMIEAIVSSSLAKNPAERPPTARAMAQQLEQALPEPTADAPTPPPGSRVVARAQPDPFAEPSSVAPAQPRTDSRPSLREKLFAEPPPAPQKPTRWAALGGHADGGQPDRRARAAALAVGLVLAGVTGFALLRVDEPAPAPPPEPFPSGSAAPVATPRVEPAPSAVSPSVSAAASARPVRSAQPPSPPAGRPAPPKPAPAAPRAPRPPRGVDTLPGSGL